MEIEQGARKAIAQHRSQIQIVFDTDRSLIGMSEAFVESRTNCIMSECRQLISGGRSGIARSRS